MVNNCANPACAKPLHYLREGRVFVFDMSDTTSVEHGRRTRHLEHFWLCGSCSQAFQLERGADGVKLLPRPAMRIMKVMPAKAAIAS
jgi:hypothetical protein